MIARTASVLLFVIALCLQCPAARAKAAPNCAAEKQKLDALKARYDVMQLERQMGGTDPDDRGAESSTANAELKLLEQEVQEAQSAWIKCREGGR